MRHFIIVKLKDPREKEALAGPGALPVDVAGRPLFHPAVDAPGVSLSGLSLQRLFPPAALVLPVPLRLFSGRHCRRPSPLAAAFDPQAARSGRHRPQGPAHLPDPPAPVHAGVRYRLCTVLNVKTKIRAPKPSGRGLFYSQSKMALASMWLPYSCFQRRWGSEMS